MKRALALILLLAACKEEIAAIPDPVTLNEDALSHFCQMNVLDHGGPKAQVHLKGMPAPLFFAQVRDAVAYLKGPERDADIVAVYVSDMGVAQSWEEPGTDNWTKADAAYFVVGAEVKGGMGAPEIVPFARADAAARFVARYGGEALSLAEIPVDLALAPVDLDAPLEDPSWPLF